MKRGGLPKGMAQQIQALQQKLQETQRELAAAEVTGSAGGGVIQVTLRGDHTCTRVEIDPDMLTDVDHEMLQDLVQTAFNHAQEELNKLTEEKMGPFSNALGM